MSLSFLPAQKGGCTSSVGVRLGGAMWMTDSSLTNLEDEVSTFALMGQWPFLSLTKSADERQNLKIVSEARLIEKKGRFSRKAHTGKVAIGTRLVHLF